MVCFSVRQYAPFQCQILQVLEEAYKVLKPGGRFMCLEFSHVPNPVLRWYVVPELFNSIMQTLQPKILTCAPAADNSFF